MLTGGTGGVDGQGRVGDEMSSSRGVFGLAGRGGSIDGSGVAVVLGGMQLSIKQGFRRSMLIVVGVFMTSIT